MRIAQLAATAAVLSLAAGAAQAAVTVTFTGTVQSGVDGAGLFGAAGANLTGLAFTSIYVVDETQIYDLSNGYYQAEGGGAYGTPLPIISASLTINGLTYTPTATYYGGFSEQNAQGFYTHLYYQNLSATYFDWLPGENLHNSCVDYYDATPKPQTCKSTNQGYFAFSNGATVGVLFNTGVSSSDPLPLGVSYVPEPITWALMIAGFGMVGASLRRRRAVAA